MIDPREFIRTKRNRQTHAPEAVREFVAAYLRKEVHDYQVSAWLMAAFLNGLDGAETDALTHALLHSGRVFDWSSLGRPSADKHSTGGVGDKISRGLGHTGGTLDKLEAIPGFRTTLPPEQMREQLDRLGIVMVGQGPDLAPADGLFYALRDVTSTVEFEPFIVSSIVSKKIAEGARAIAYDVKCGSGAFMKTPEQARSLAKRLVATSKALGANAAALITDMNWPLGGAVGNALEVREACETLHGAGPADTRELTVELSALMLRLAGAVPNDEAGRLRARRALDDGTAWEVFLRMVQAQGGDPKSLENPGNLHPAPVVSMVPAERDGVVAGCDCFALGELIVSIGGGRRAKEDAIDPRVGLVVLRQPGDVVRKGEPLAELHLAAPDLGIVERANECFSIADAASPRGTTLMERIE